MPRERISPQSKVIMAIMSEDSPCCEVTHHRPRPWPQPARPRTRLSFCCPPPPLLLVGVSIWMERGCQQNDSAVAAVSLLESVHRCWIVW